MKIGQKLSEIFGLGRPRLGQAPEASLKTTRTFGESTYVTAEGETKKLADLPAPNATWKDALTVFSDPKLPGPSQFEHADDYLYRTRVVMGATACQSLIILMALPGQFEILALSAGIAAARFVGTAHILTSPMTSQFYSPAIRRMAHSLLINAKNENMQVFALLLLMDYGRNSEATLDFLGAILNSNASQRLKTHARLCLESLAKDGNESANQKLLEAKIQVEQKG
jgi:hypothetical protein